MPPLTPAELTRAGALYLPVLLALAAGVYRRARPIARLFPAALLSALWTLPALLLLQHLNLHAKWWTYTPGSAASLLSMPVELYLGWAVLWGIVPPLLLARRRHYERIKIAKQRNPGLRTVPIAGASVTGNPKSFYPSILVSAALLFLLDLALMPACKAAVTLGPNWLRGEAVALVLVLLPALALAAATQANTHLGLRGALQIVLAAGLFLYWVPEVTFTLSHTHARLFSARLAFACALLLALPGLGGVLEFVQRGRGTPIPYDPPTRLVTSGIYRFVANPMQLSCVLVMLAWAALLHNAWLVIPAIFAVVYSAGLAAWDEHQDLHTRFGQPWVDYRQQVRDWLPRFTPYHAGPPARLYYAHTCVVCSELGQWLAARQPLGLVLLPAESLAQTPNRLLYIAPDGTADHGTRAFARTLEHLNLAYALAGLLLRLPGPAHLIQLVMDTSGFGPQTIPTTCNLKQS